MTIAEEAISYELLAVSTKNSVASCHKPVANDSITI
jgi:hypothetical protein